ncbi:Variable outer membrane protein (plasmid) [Borrelia nietonii YOR]|uniref:Variable outer membrane protein n=1 Tax=Borrelia nietonii YOR TaxID=1293576 RepID=W5SAR3_9SPIR|nr:Variable outer membrane protein [Borrelia nietonii YOR]
MDDKYAMKINANDTSISPVQSTSKATISNWLSKY